MLEVSYHLGSGLADHDERNEPRTRHQESSDDHREV